MSGYTLTTAASIPVTISGANQTVDFGYETTAAPPSTYAISGFLYIDENNNGIHDSGDVPIDAAIVTLNTGLIAYTDDAGQYSFTGLINGNYVVSIDQSQKRLLGFNSVSLPTVLVTISGADRSLDFQFEKLSLSISGVLFHDLDTNGQRDAGEPGIAGGTVYLYSDSVWLESISDADGFYSFNDLTADTYFFEFNTAGYQPPDNYYLPFDLTTESLTVDWAMTDTGG